MLAEDAEPPLIRCGGAKTMASGPLAVWVGLPAATRLTIETPSPEVDIAEPPKALAAGPALRAATPCWAVPPALAA
jgi:hypothetical protein